jgi:hypothetical protein
MATIRIIGLINGQPTEHDGKYVVRYDPRGCMETNRIILETTTNKAFAQYFPTAREAIECWRWAVGTREDGKPNRPLTAWSVEIA